MYTEAAWQSHNSIKQRYYRLNLQRPHVTGEGSRCTEIPFKKHQWGCADLIPETTKDGESILQSTRDVLKEKHPLGKDPEACSLIEGEPEPVNPITFDGLDADSIRHTALHTHGAAGPSGLDAYAWRRLCSSFMSASNSLCIALAGVGRRIATTSVNPEGLSAFVASRLIPLNKCPGVRPIGFGEVPRRIIAKAILKIIGSDVEEAAGPLQLCAGQDGGCEAAVHAM